MTCADIKIETHTDSGDGALVLMFSKVAFRLGSEV